MGGGVRAPGRYKKMDGPRGQLLNSLSRHFRTIAHSVSGLGSIYEQAANKQITDFAWASLRRPGEGGEGVDPGISYGFGS